MGPYDISMVSATGRTTSLSAASTGEDAKLLTFRSSPPYFYSFVSLHRLS